MNETYPYLSVLKNSFRLYVPCLYWSTMTLTTIGYGDVVLRVDVRVRVRVRATIHLI